MLLRDETPGFVAPAATVERPKEIIDDNEDTPAPAATDERLYAIMLLIDETPGAGCLAIVDNP